MSKKAKTNDFFADIAAQKTDLRRVDLVEPEPPDLPDLLLPVSDDTHVLMPEAVPGIETAEQLDEELQIAPARRDDETGLAGLILLTLEERTV